MRTELSSVFSGNFSTRLDSVIHSLCEVAMCVLVKYCCNVVVRLLSKQVILD